MFLIELNVGDKKIKLQKANYFNSNFKKFVKLMKLYFIVTLS